jgi:hypothetical protein
MTLDQDGERATGNWEAMECETELLIARAEVPCALVAFRLHLC